MEHVNRDRRVGLVLSGGGARGYAHIGVLSVLEQTDIEPDVVAGTSMGAIIGGLYAAGYSAPEIHDLASSIRSRDVIDLSLQGSLIKGEKLDNVLSDLLPDTFAQLQKPFAVTTTDVETGEKVIITEGNLIRAIRASSSFPGAFPPLEINGRLLADGGIINNLPVDAAAILGANYTIASDTTPPRRSEYQGEEQGNWWERMVSTVRLERRSPLLQMLLRSADIMQSILTDLQHTMHPADILVKLEMPDIHVESFRDYDEIVRIGEEIAIRTFTESGLLPQSAVARLQSVPELDA